MTKARGWQKYVQKKRRPKKETPNPRGNFFFTPAAATAPPITATFQRYDPIVCLLECVLFSCVLVLVSFFLSVCKVSLSLSVCVCVCCCVLLKGCWVLCLLVSVFTVSSCLLYAGCLLGACLWFSGFCIFLLSRGHGVYCDCR